MPKACLRLNKKKKLIVFSILFTYLTQFCSTAVVNQVLTNPVDGSARLTGSIFGGTRLYIYGDGFDSNDYDNVVYVGSELCPIDNYYTSPTLLVCEMEEKFYGTQDDLVMRIYVKKQLVPCKGNTGCYVDLALRYTPFIYSIEPQSVFAGEFVNIHGIWRSSLKSEVREIRIAGRNCVISDGIYEDENSLSYSGADYVYCQIPEDMPIGDHQLSVASSKGTGFNSPHRESLGFKVGFEIELYNLRVHPKIESVSSNSGYLGGQSIKITGQGFSSEFSSDFKKVMVGDLNCSITSFTDTEINCEIEATDAAPTDALFKGGAGAQQRIFDLYTTKFSDYFGNDQENFDEESVLLSLENRIRKDKYLQKVWGVFTTGSTEAEYTFKLSSDDESEFYLSPDPIDYTKPFDESTDMAKVCEVNGWNDFREFHHEETQVTKITLKAYSDYYFSLFHAESDGLDHFTLGVIVPGNTNSDLPNTKKRVQKVSIRNTPVRQIMEIEMRNATGGTFNLIFSQRNEDTGEITYIRQATNVKYNSTASEMSSKIRSAIGTSNSVVLMTYDASNTLITDDTTVPVKFIWRITFNSHRSRNIVPIINETDLTSENTISSEVRVVQEQSDPVQGNFTLGFADGVSGTINYNSSDGTVRDRLQDYIEILSTGVEVYDEGSSVDGKSWFISIADSLGDTVPLTVVENNLVLGTTNTTVQIDIDPDFESSSNDLVYLPVPSEFLRSIHTKPQITVQITDMYAGCVGNTCDYTFISEANTPEITATSISGNTLTLTVAFPSATRRLLQEKEPERLLEETPSTSFQADDLFIKIGNTICENVAVSSTTITCDIPQNSDNSLEIEVGNHTPMVHEQGKGFLRVNASVNTIDETLAISNVNPSQGSTGGGTEITISGTGFAINNQYGSSSQVEIDGEECKIISSNNIEIVCMTPPEPSGGSGEIKVKVFPSSDQSVFVETTSNSFSYSASKTPTVVSMSPSSASPVIKQDLTITGTNFGTSASDLTVTLVSPLDSDFNLPCNVVDSPAPTNTQLTCRLGGGSSGEFNVQVNRSGYGASVAASTDSDKFEFIIEITNVSPRSGSIQGGTIVTITGNNFSTVKNENQVTIGDSRTNLCEIITATATEIVCRTMADSSGITTGQDLRVLGRIQEVAICNTNCKFTYQEQKTPKILSLSPESVKSGDTVTVSGSNFTVNANKMEINVGGVMVPTSDITVASVTSLTFVMPQVSHGTYIPSFYFDNTGNPEIVNEIKLINFPEISAVSPATGSKFGEILTISGKGLNDEMTIKVDNKNCNLISASPSEIVCKLIAQTKTDQDLAIQVKYEDSGGTSLTMNCATCVYNPQADSPKITTEVSSSLDDPSSVVLTFTGDYLVSNNQDPSVPYTLSDISGKLVSNNSTLEIDSVLTVSDPNVVLTFSNVPGGEYSLEYYIDGVGFAKLIASYTAIMIPLQVDPIPPVDSSFLGGGVLTIPGNFPPNEYKEDITVNVCEEECTVISSSTSSLDCLLPELYTEEVHSLLPSKTPSLQRDAMVTADGNYKESNSILDGNKETYYNGADNDTCFLQLDYKGYVIQATQIRFFPRLNSDEKNLVGAIIEIAMDENGTWTQIAEIDDEVTENWNNFRPDASEEWKFKYLRFKGGVRDCSLAELEVLGYRFKSISGFNTASHSCNVEIMSAGITMDPIQNNIVTYKASETPSVTSISPNMGTTAGGTSITITGTNFNSDSTVTIDGVNCPTDSVSATQIICTTSARPTFTESTFVVNSATVGDASNDGNFFFYVDRWSDENTWGGESLPRAGDSVFVPKGQVLLVDVSTPILFTVIVEGVLIFEDVDLTFDAWFILVKDGQFIAGTEENPFMNKLTITLHGTRQSQMLPGFGNKSIMVQNGQIDIHGEPRMTTWTLLDTSVDVGATSLTVMDNIDWKAGETIILAPTSRNRHEVEELTISSVSGKTVNFVEPLKFKHFAGTINPNDPNNQDGPFDLRAEVGLLTRNVKVQGDESTLQTKHGAHIMIRGDEGVARGRFSYFEMYLAGQLFQLGRYPIHYHMIGFVDDSFIKGCSVHHTFNRGTTIHGVHYLTLSDNVYYRTTGHTIFMEDGIETNNVVENNLVVHVSPASSLLMSDMTPGCLWQARPTNFIRNNHFVGSAGNGSWFELVSHPTGPSSTSSICSKGDPLTQYDNNVAHANSLGLRVYPIFEPKTHPCQSHFNGSLRDPYSHNPGVPAVFRGNIQYMNSIGSFSKKIGAVQYVEQKMVSNGTNQSVQEPDLAKDSLPRTENSVSIGDSEISAYHETKTATAINIGRKSGFLVKDTRFYNFSTGDFISLCSSCDNEKKRVPGGVRTNFENVRLEGVTCNMVKYLSLIHI